MLKVIIADEDSNVANVLAEFLVVNGYDVCGTARTVMEALDLFVLHRPSLAVIAVILAEGGRGTEIAARLNRPRALGVLYTTLGLSERGLTKADGDACITKPYGPADILRALEIVQQIVTTGDAPPPFPARFWVLRP